MANVMDSAYHQQEQLGHWNHDEVAASTQGSKLAQYRGPLAWLARLLQPLRERGCRYNSPTEMRIPV